MRVINAVPVEKDWPVAVKVPEIVIVAEPAEKDWASAVNWPGVRIMNDVEPVEVDAPDAVIAWKDSGGIEMAAEPVDVDEPEAVIACRIIK